MKSFSLIKPYLVKHRYLIFFGLLCLVAVDMLQLFIPHIIKQVIDDLTLFQIDLGQLLSYALYIAGIAVMIGVFRYGWRRCLIGMSRSVEQGLRNSLLEHVQTLSVSYFDRMKTGDLMAHATNDIQHVRMAMGMGVVALTDAIVLSSASICVMLYINTLLTLYVLIPMPLIVFGTRFFSKKMHSLYQAVQASFADLTEAVRERFAGIRVIKAYNLEEQESLRINTISKNYINRNLRLVRTTGLFFPMLIFFSNVSLAIVLFLGGRKTITLDITPGDFVAFISYLGLLTWPMMAMGWVINLIQRGKASLDRINTILSVKPEIDETAHAGSLKEIKNSMVFENVSFSYTGNDSLVLSNININLKHGSILGIIGPQGSGKTTLLNLIPRLYEVSSGKILIDGINISEVSPRDLRSLVSFMPQEPFLFAGSIKQNILTGTGEEKSSQLKSAAEKAALYDTVKLFPGGFDTIIGEKGIILSGGQKQRIALARAFIHDRPVMIFDDPVSQVDMETGNLIIKNIKSMARRKTVIIVSHRLSAVRFADLIISLDSGKIVESGTHEQLMQNNGYYAKTFRLQEIEEEINAN